MSRWIGCRWAAWILDVDPATVRGWARKRLAGAPSRIRYARKVGSKYQVSRREIRSLKAEAMQRSPDEPSVSFQRRRSRRKK